MANITIYFDNIDSSAMEFVIISETEELSNDSIIHIGAYGEESFTITNRDCVTNPLYFTAQAYEGYTFTRWVMRTGTVQGDVIYDYNNPFKYNGNLNLFIRAEGEEEQIEEEPEWVREGKIIGTISEDYEDSLYIDSYTLYRYRIKFANNGTATFYTTGTSVDTIGFLTETSGFNSVNGTPSGEPIATDDDSGSGNNFKFTCDVNANQIYYFWIRAFDPEDTGSIWFYIIAPDNERPEDFYWYEGKNGYKVQSASFDLTAEEWIDFTQRINDFRKYRGLSNNYDFSSIEPGDLFTANIYNEAVEAIQEIEGYGAYLEEVVKGQEVTAQLLNILIDELNAIP